MQYQSSVDINIASSLVILALQKTQLTWDYIILASSAIYRTKMMFAITDVSAGAYKTTELN
jgi:hypothetical protein